MAALNNVVTFAQRELLSPLQAVGYSLLDFAVGLLLAAVIVALGAVVAWAVHWVVKELLDRAKADKWLRKHNLDKSLGVASVSQLTSTLVGWYIFLIFLIPAISYITLGELTGLLLSIVTWLPRVVVAVALVMVGFMLADFVSDRLSKAKGPAVKHVSNVVRVLIVVFVIVVALQEVGIYLRLAESTFLILLTGVTLGLSLAFGIGFGLGFKDDATQLVKQWRKRL